MNSSNPSEYVADKLNNPVTDEQHSDDRPNVEQYPVKKVGPSSDSSNRSGEWSVLAGGNWGRHDPGCLTFEITCGAA